MGKKSKRERLGQVQGAAVQRQPRESVGNTRVAGNTGEMGKLWHSLALGGALFLLMIYFAGYSIPFFAGLPLVGLTLAAVSAARKERPVERFSLPGLLFLAFVLLCGAASLYASSREIASEEFGKWFAAFWLFVIAVLLFKKSKVRTLLLGLAAAIALSAVFSVDASSWGKLTELVLGTILRVDTSGYGYWGDGRISGMFGNPNISGSMLALGIFLSLYAVRTAKGRGERAVAYSTLAFSSMAFLLSFSMGSIGFFVVGVAVYLAAAGREERPGLLLLMAETAVSTVLFSVVATLGLGKEGAITLIPNLVMVLNCLVIWQLDTRVGQHLAEKLAANGRAAGLALGGAAALALLYIVLGFHITGGMGLAPGQWVTRSAYPEAGEYTLSAEGVSDLYVAVRAQNSQQTAMHTSTTLYEGGANGATFTVPEGTRVVYFDMSSAQGGAVSSVEYGGPSGGGALKLKYLLLPEFAATRIQGLWANQNVVQRVTFFEDALKIWRMSPVFGMGTGAFERYRPQVANFYYSTRYVHNVYLQVMAETGLAGLLLLLGLAAFFFLAALRGRRDGEYGGMAAPLLACLAMMWGHGSFEVIWSSKPYLLVAALLLAAVQGRFGEQAVWKGATSKGGRRTAAAVGAAAAVVFSTLFLMEPYYDLEAGRASRTGDYPFFMGKIAQAARLDLYERDNYRGIYLQNVFFEEDEGTLRIADGYAQALAAESAYPYGVYAAEYYFQRGETALAFSALEGAALRGRADPAVWDGVVEAAMGAYQAGDAEMEAGVRSLLALWEKTSGEQLDGIALSGAQEQFLRGFEGE